MEFNVKLIDRRGGWLLLYLIGLGLLVGWLTSLLNVYNAFLAAGSGVVVLFGGGWLFWRIELAIQQPVRISVLANALVILNQRTGKSTYWPFEEIKTYRYFPTFRGSTTLRFTLQSGEVVKLIALDTGLSNTSTNQFAAMASAFEADWLLHKGQ